LKVQRTAQRAVPANRDNWPALFCPSGYGGMLGKQQSGRMKDLRLINHKQGIVMTKQLLTKLPTICLGLTMLLGTAYGGIPSMDVTVFDATEKVVFKQSIKADAAFATGSLRAGNYVVQFNTKNQAVKNNQYLAVVSSGQKKVIAAAVPGEKFMAGGAAMKIDVGSGMQITGKVVAESDTARRDGPMVRTINGKRYVWVDSRVGTNFGPRWEEQGLANSNNVSSLSQDKMRRIQDSAYEGSMLDRYHAGAPYEVHTHY
jgi:hypothetical protein